MDGWLGGCVVRWVDVGWMVGWSCCVLAYSSSCCNASISRPAQILLLHLLVDHVSSAPRGKLKFALSVDCCRATPHRRPKGRQGQQGCLLGAVPRRDPRWRVGEARLGGFSSLLAPGRERGRVVNSRNSSAPDGASAPKNLTSTRQTSLSSAHPQRRQEVPAGVGGGAVGPPPEVLPLQVWPQPSAGE